MKVIMRIFEYTCGQCGKVYRAAQPTGTYGTLVFRDESGEFAAAVDALTNPLFAQVSAAVDRQVTGMTVSDHRRGKVVQQVVGHISDPAPSGSNYDPDAKPACKHCRASTPISWRAIEADEIVVLDIPMLEHRNWDALSEPAKRKRLGAEINVALSG